MAADLLNVIIIGSGPAGYTAAVYLARARLAPLMFSGQEIGGQLMYTTEVENYPGFPEGVQGPKLMMDMRKQAQRFGTQIIDRKVEAVAKDGDHFVVTVGAETYRSKTVIVATGATSRMLGLPNETQLLGRGLSTCAVCDAAFYRDRVAYVIGGGDSAMEDTLALTKFAKEVYVVHRRGEFRASKIMQERVLNHEKVQVLWNTEVVELQSENKLLKSLVLRNIETSEQTTRPADGVFYAIGHLPQTKFLNGFVALNEEGYITTNFVLDQRSAAQAQYGFNEQGRMSFVTQTSVEGVFAAGDCVDFRYRQAVTAAAYGTMAALDVERWLEQHE